MPERPKPLFPREIPLLVQRTFAQRQCVECHLIGDFQNIQREQDGVLDKLTHLYRSPDIKTLGIELDVPKGLVVKEARGAAQAAGMKAGDRIAQLERHAGVDIRRPAVSVRQGGPQGRQGDGAGGSRRQSGESGDRAAGALVVDRFAFPPIERGSAARFRRSSAERGGEGQAGADAGRLRQPGEIRFGFRQDPEDARLRVGDIIYAVDGVERDEIANTAELFIKLRKMPGESVTLGRDSQRAADSRCRCKTYQ